MVLHPHTSLSMFPLVICAGLLSVLHNYFKKYGKLSVTVSQRFGGKITLINLVKKKHICYYLNKNKCHKVE